ncbi:hypothetical protein SAMN05518845_11671 [Variovorax sp. YR750]|uniref:hypothetical protein n=1 Tax=Variovorax sp. YR750 TaxID=1884384 RepID=UPI0008CF447C|nr:hypothetical protein [Variovorax sp. YR750]SEM10130.1 hypothetical protein SAMN05518845_11671 [Variovorax sp. YR750]
MANSMMDEGALEPRVTRFSSLEIYTIEQALREVWARLNSDPAWLAKATTVFVEDDFSQAIVQKINQLIGDVALWNGCPILHLLSETVDPFPSYNTKNTSHQKIQHGQSAFDTIPDFFFRRRTEPGRSPMSDGFFIEAKVIDPGKTMANYCGKGLKRYVDGLYAWDMSQAMMLGYVRKTTQTLPTALKNHLSGNGKKEEYQLQSGPTKTDLSQMEIWMHDTVHGRPNPHPETGAANCAITVFHLWLRTPC